ncbi:hypothetical protein DFR58_12737 [Anaerobacterium chartisolvens]|uniref:Uncharacterized protein n=1 Tax=Anaerobacterium chartisolvens TaxID=1297424 RepID=A0A369APQ8_9FIRM|nr:hypothetical protein [Anaerobacterium chartisolvens]RCX11161.1 hypothetical protein DFR58_12737 [Anaerobacterium chartisolvens]
MFRKHSGRLSKYLAILLTVFVMLTNIAGTAFATDSEIIAQQLGGAYNSIKSALGGDRHHCFAGEVYDSTYVYKFDANRNVTGYVTRDTGPCVLMTKADHQKTASWGSSTAAKAYRAQQLELVKQGRHLAAMQMDINDIRSKFGSKYNTAISKMWTYATGTLGWSK